MGGLGQTGLFKAFVIMIAFHVVAISLAQAEEIESDKNCAELSQDLMAMQKAQHQLLSAFEQKTTGLATTFDIHAENLQKALKKNGVIKKSDLQGLKRSATALRKHQIKETDLVGRFEKASGALLDQVQSCLAKNSKFSSNKSVADSSLKN